MARLVASPSSSDGPGERVVLRVGLAAGEGLADEHVDGDAVLGVHHDRGAALPGHLHGPQDGAVVGVEDARVGHEQLEAGDALGLGEVPDRLERLLVDAAHDLVERVVDRALALGLGVPVGEAVEHVLARPLHGHVDDRGDPAPRGGDRAGLERVRRERAAEGQLHVRVHVDAAGDDVLAGRVDDLVRALLGRLEPAGRADRDDRLPVDEDVVDHPAARVDDGAVLDQGSRHRVLLRPG